MPRQGTPCRDVRRKRGRTPAILQKGVDDRLIGGARRNIERGAKSHERQKTRPVGQFGACVPQSLPFKREAHAAGRHTLFLAHPSECGPDIRQMIGKGLLGDPKPGSLQPTRRDANRCPARRHQSHWPVEKCRHPAQRTRPMAFYVRRKIRIGRDRGDGRLEGKLVQPDFSATSGANRDGQWGEIVHWAGLLEHGV